MAYGAKLEGSEIERFCSKEVGRVVTIVEEVIMGLVQKIGMHWDPLCSCYTAGHESKTRN